MTEPIVFERSYDLWEVYSPSSEGISFSSEKRDLAEEWLTRLARPENDLIIRRVPVRTRCETWWSDPQIIPWYAPCTWVGEVGCRDIALECRTHDWKHKKGEPVPREFWRGKVFP